MKKLIFFLFLISLYSNKGSSQPFDLVIDGSFDLAGLHWPEFSDFHITNTSQYVGACSPWGYAWFASPTGDYPSNGSFGYFYQAITIPANAFYADLTFSYSISTQETSFLNANDILSFQVYVGGSWIPLYNLSNLDASPCTQSIIIDLSQFIGQSILIGFVGSTDYNGLGTKFRIDDVSLMIDALLSCVTWTNGIPTDQYFVDATENLCQAGLINSVQDNTVPTYLTRSDIATILFNGLFGMGNTSPAEYFPTPFLDLADAPSLQEQIAYKTMLYCQYNDHETAFSRDVFALYPMRTLFRGNCLKAIFEAWNIPVNNYSPYYSDVSQNDPNYKYITTAFVNGYLNNTSFQSCNSFPSFCPNQPITRSDLYIILNNILLQGFIPPTPNSNDFFFPNTFLVSNISNRADLDRAVFNDYEQSSFSIPGGGIPLEFNHSYHSNWTELPIAPGECLSLDWYKKVHNPLGIGWTHSYNIHISKVFDFYNSICTRLIIWWPDGSVQSYNVLSQQYETVGVTDELQIVNVDGNGVPQKVVITKKDGIIYEFNLIYVSTNSQFFDLSLTVIRNRNHQSLAVTYGLGLSIDGNPVNRVNEVIDNFSGRRLYFSYQPTSNYLSSVSDNSGRTVSFSVNPVTHNLESFTDAKNQITHYQYDNMGAHLLERIQRPKGNWIDNTYNQRKLRNSNSNSYNISVQFTPNYFSSNVSTSSNISVTQSGNSFSSTVHHDERGNAVSIVTPSGNISCEYNDLNNPDKPTKITDHSTNIVTNITYEPNKKSNPILVTTSNAGQSLIEQFSYNSFNQVTQYINPENQVVNYLYDLQGNLTDIYEPNGIHTHNDYFSNGLLNYSVSPTNITTHCHYNAYGNLDSIYISGTNVYAAATYDNVSRIIAIKNANGNVTTYGYDANDNLTLERDDPSGQNLITQRFYDSNDNLISIIAPNGDVTNLTYDFITDQLISETYGAHSRNWTYNLDGTVQSYINKNGFNFQFHYFPPGNPNAGKVSSDGYASYQYDNITRRLIKTIRGNRELSYAYDGLGRVNNVSYNDIASYSNTVTYEYHHNSSNLKSVSYPLPSGFTPFKVEYLYDGNNRLAQVKNANTGYVFVQYSYRDDHKLGHEVFGNGVSTYYYYDSAGRLDSIASVNSSNSPLAAVGSTLDPLGNYIRESQRVNLNGPSNPPNGSISDTTINFIYNNMNRLTSVGPFTFSYNNDGAVVSDATSNATYTWDERDNMLTTTVSSFTTNYQYGPAESRRMRDTIRFILDVINNDNILIEANPSGIPQSIYVYGLGLVCRIDPLSGAASYYHYDFRGSTIAITDSNQLVNQKYSYDAFGALTNSDGWGNIFANPFRFVGKYGVVYDDYRQYYMRARNYSPQLGRFISEDPKWDINLYPYSGNNPVINIDPNGEYFESLLDIASLSYNIYEFSIDPTVLGVVFITADLVTTALPFAFSGGTFLRGYIAAKRANNYSDAMVSAFERQLKTHGKNSLERSLSSIQKRLNEHNNKLKYYRNNNNYYSSVKREINTFRKQIKAIKRLLR